MCDPARNVFSSYGLTVVHLSKRNMNDPWRNVLTHRCPLIKEKYMGPREKCSHSPLSTYQREIYATPREMFSLTAVRVPAGERPLHLGNTNHLAKLEKFTIIVLKIYNSKLVWVLSGTVSALSQFYSRNNNLCITHRLSVMINIIQAQHGWSQSHAKKVFFKV
jgi:hypothetical protein